MLDTVVYSTGAGRITRQEGLAFTQFLAVKPDRKSRYFNTLAGAKKWLERGQLGRHNASIQTGD